MSKRSLRVDKATDSSERAHRPPGVVDQPCFEELEARTLMSVPAINTSVPLIIPTGVAAQAVSPTSVAVSWSDADTNAIGYVIVRSDNASPFYQIGKITSAATRSYVDAAALPNHNYRYEIIAFNSARSSAASAPAAVKTPMAPPSALTAKAQGSSSVLLSWKDNDPSATGYRVLRTLDGKNFITVKTIVGGAAASYLDTSVLSGLIYGYEVQAYSSAASSAVTPMVKAAVYLAAPKVQASSSTVDISLAWTGLDAGAKNYLVQRSIDGKTFTTIATLGPTATSYVDSSVAAATKYYYRVQAYSLTAPAGTSSVVQAATKPNTVVMSTRFGSEVVINTYGSGDTVSVTQTGQVLNLILDGQVFSQVVLPGGLFIYDHAGSDTISIDPSVTVRTTITALGSGATTVSSSSANVSAWLDTGDQFYGSGNVHWVTTLAGGVSKDIGASLPNPTDSGTTFKLSASLFGSGPVADDVVQGGVGDCYFLSSLAAFADVAPSVILESAVDMGDSTYIVQFEANNAPVFVRVSNDIPTGNYWGYAFARPGDNNTMWAPIMEKAYAYFRTGANSYASLNSGWMGDVYAALDVTSSSLGLKGISEANLFNTLAGKLTKGMAVTLATDYTAATLVKGHAYTLMDVYRDANGVARFTVRNPWGVSGDSLENSAGYATLTFSQMTSNFVYAEMALA